MEKTQIVVNRKSLENEVAFAKKIIGRSASNIAIVGNLLLTFLPDGIAVQCTNLETAYMGVLGNPANRKHRLPKKAPQILIDSARLKTVLSKLPKKLKEVSLETTWDGDGIMVNGSTTIVRGGDTNDYPSLPSLPWGKSHDLLSYDNLLQVSGISVADDKRAHLNCLYVDAGTGHLVSTDGSRLYSVKIPSADIEPFMIPKFAAGLFLTPQLRNEIGAVRIDRKNQNVFIETGHGYITTRIPDAYFPDYKAVLAVMDDDPSAVISTDDKQTMVDALTEATGILSGYYASVTISVDDQLVLSAENPDCGEFKKNLSDAFTFIGDAFEAAFNPKYFIDACETLKEKGLNVFLFGEGKPAIIPSPCGDFQAVIMPMRD